MVSEAFATAVMVCDDEGSTAKSSDVGVDDHAAKLHDLVYSEVCTCVASCRVGGGGDDELSCSWSKAGGSIADLVRRIVDTDGWASDSICSEPDASVHSVSNFGWATSCKESSWEAR